MSKEEIELLRAEIIQNYNAIAQYNCVLYTAVTAVLAFAVNSDRYVMCLLPYVVMLPIHFLCETRSGNICRIGAYLYVFSGENLSGNPDFACLMRRDTVQAHLFSDG